jgi:hypothetical protein
MPQSPSDPTPSPNHGPAENTSGRPAPTPPDDLGPANSVQWFGRPDPGEKPIGVWRLIVITLSGHIGVRPRAKRHEDFRRANGLHVFIAAIAYFALVIGALILLVNLIVNQ